MLIPLIALFLSVNLCFKTIVPLKPSTSFIETGSITLFDAISSTNHTQNYEISFNQNFTAIPTLAVTLQTIESPSKYYGFCFRTSTQSVNQTGFQVSVTTCNNIILSKLKIQYLAMDPSLKFNIFIKEYQIYNLTTTGEGVNLQLKANCTSLFGDNYVQDYQRPYSWASLKSLTVYPIKNPFYSMNMKTSLSCIYPEQYFRLNVQELFLYDFTDLPIILPPILTNIITYIKVIVIATKSYKYHREIKITTFYQTTDYLANQQSFTFRKSIKSDYLVGIYQFRTSSSCTFGFGWDKINTTDSLVTLSAIVNFIGITQSYLTVGVRFNYQVFNIYNCSYPYIYYNYTSGLCQDDCESGSYLSFDTYTCIKCQSFVCIQCNSNNNGCAKCNQSLGYIQANDTCVCPTGFTSNSMNQSYECTEICGDGKVFTNQCDDGNTLNGDGCSSKCIIQNGSWCANGTSTSPSNCTILTTTPPLIVIYFTKQEDANAFNIQLAPKNQLGRLLTEINNNTIFIQNGTVFYLNFPYESVTYKSAPVNHLSLRITYTQSLNDQTLSMTFVTSTEGLITITYPPVTDNNLALKVYSSQQYKTFLIFKTLMPIFSYALWFVLILVFFFVSKLIAIQTLFIFQFTYGGLIMLKKLEPVMYTYKYLWVFNGFNHLYNDGVYVPPQVSTINYNADFIANFNIDLVIFILPIIVGAIFLLANRIRNNNKIQKQGFSILFEWQLSVMLFCIQQLVFAFILNLQYSPNKIQGAFIGSILLLIYAAYAVVMFIKINDMKNSINPLGQYRTQINRKGKINIHFYLLVMIYRLSVSLVLVLDSWSIVSDSIIFIITAVWTALLIWRRPYKQNIRPIINSSVIFLLSIFFLYCRHVADSSYINFATYIPIAVICLIGLTALTNISFAARMFYLLKFPKKSNLQMVEAISATKTEGTNTGDDNIALDIVSSYTRQNNKAAQVPMQEMLDKFTNSEPSRMKLTETRDQNSPIKTLLDNQ